MTAAATKQEEKTRTRGATEVTAFNKKYAEALEEAEISAKHTATEGWQQLYQSQLARTDKRRKELAGMLHGAATSIERGESGKILEDLIGDCKKDFVTLCAEAAVFDRQTVDPVKEAMFICHNVIEQAIREAKTLEANSPLMSKGVLEAVTKAVADVPKVIFDSASGRIEIKPPPEDK